MPRPISSTWSGSINFGGFPISLRAYPLVQSRSAASFKSLCSCHQQPITMPKRCPVDDRPLESSELLKGHQTGKDTYAVVPPEAAEQIRTAESTKVLEIKGIPPRDSVPMGLTTNHYRLVPDEKVPGSDGPAQILWNGLHASGRVVVTEWVPKAGSRDSILVVEGDAFGLTGHTLPYKSELRVTPEFKPVEDDKAAGMFEAFAATAEISMDSFHHTEYESAYEQRRDAAIQAALSGQPIQAAAAAPAQAATPDLMALMEAAVAEAKSSKPKKAPAKPRAKKATVKA